MGTKYSSQSASGYNSSPPIDDGSQVASNLVTWSGVKTKLSDPVKTLADAENTALVTVFDLSARAISSNDTAIASDHWRTLQVTGATTIQLSSAASMAAGYEVGIFNAGVNTVTVTPAGSDTINGVSASVTVPTKGSMIFRTNQALTGYNCVSQNAQVAILTTATVTTGTTTPLNIGNSNGVWAVDAGASAGLKPPNDNTESIGDSTHRIKTVFTPNVQFPAAQITSPDVNCLDDYEEGSWTPSLGGNTTYTVQTASYTKIGNRVCIDGAITVNAIGTGSTTLITGLPFTVGVSTAISVVSLTASATAVVSANIVATSGTTGLTVISRTAASASDAANAVFQNATSIVFAGVYRV